MAITADVKKQLFTPSASGSTGEAQLIRLPNESGATVTTPSHVDGSAGDGIASPTNTNGQAWTAEEHDRFLEGLELFPSGPWKEIAAHVGSRTTRQTMTHAQKYREKIARRKRGLRASSQARALRRRREQQQRKQQREHKTAELTHVATSPCSVSDQKLTGNPVVHRDDPLGFHGGIFAAEMAMTSATQYQQFQHANHYNHGVAMKPELEFGGATVDYASFMSDFDPLPMSEEEIDFILEAAMRPAPPSTQQPATGLHEFVF